MGWENSIFSSTHSEHRWVDEIAKYFENEVAFNINQLPVSIFHVPKSISAVKPEAYVPQFIGLGPYHHTRTDLYDMERYKLAAVTSFLKPHHIQNFQQLLIDKLIEFEPFVRACYHKYLDLDNQTLAWIMAIDGLFLLNILSNYDGRSTGTDGRVRVLTQDAVFNRDAMVLENQIPVILLKEIRKSLQLSSSNDNDDNELFFMLRGFCEAICPLKLAETNSETVSCLHLVDLMYNLIVNHGTIKQSVVHIEEPHEENTTIAVEGREEEEGSMINNMEEIIEVGMSLGIEKKILRPIKVVQNMPWDSISNLLGLKSCQATHDHESKTTPLIEEIKIPSVTHLSKRGGIKFSHTVGGIRDLKFVEQEATLYPPVLTLNANSEVVLRNLVAYEVTIASENTLELSQYVDLMSGIIDTAEDARYLREKGIIKGDLSNEKIADLFNGMNKCSGKGRNDTIEKINEYYNSRPAVRLNQFLKKNIYSCWKLLTLISTALILLMLLLHSIWEVYGISHVHI